MIGSKVMKPHVYRNRLLALAEFLYKLPEKQFKYTHWNDSNECGTVACALGWACYMPRFQKLGLFMSKARNRPVMKGISGDSFDAARHLFGLSLQEAFFLFYPGSFKVLCTEKCAPGANAVSKEVAKHIADFAIAKFGSKKICSRAS